MSTALTCSTGVPGDWLGEIVILSSNILGVPQK
jgi:hypothetical protein